MMQKYCFSILLFTCLLLGALPALGQDYEQMRKEIAQKQQETRARINELNEQIKKYEQRLKQANKKYQSLYDKYQNLKNLIALQDQKIQKLQSEQSQISEEIQVTQKSLQKKRRELKKLVENYKKTLSYLYKHGRTSQLTLILSSSSINQMLVRSYYLEKFNRFREKQAEQIQKAKKELEQTEQELLKARSKNKEVLAEIKQEKQQLNKKREVQARNVELLRENKEEIKNKVAQKKKELDNIESILASYNQREQEIIEAQREAEIERRERERKENLEKAKNIEDDEKRAKEVAKYSKPIDKSEVMTDARLKELETSFAQNKGSLPWPVKSRTISEHFGRRRHPVYGTVTPNIGIEIVTDAAAPVKTVHDGFVIDVRPVPGYGDVVFVKHGRFITAYGNLSEIKTQEMAMLEQGDVIGLSGVPESTRGESVFFLIRKDNQNLDPENWLQMQTASKLK